ncbi:Lrp/AsnC family transcriptional regulator [Polymorphospora rubra]|uniref:AsnC family transcriptional regulator n=1 Tax=Polymorphospora rubra TaxID=338584 RepID=A0A810N9N0_9ACTN|nr:Lrp/AsnC family transcriptional regulator [Polymorphospora rubra]BCJ69947.1 AsnC family transcriptional regulator [Polymorphospora rubra]
MTILGRVTAELDQLDARLLDLFTREPRIGVLEASRQLRVARGTVQARLDRLLARGVIRSFAPEVDPAALGYPVTAFVSVEITQSVGHETVAALLVDIPEVLEAHTITGTADMLLRVVARSNADLQRVIDRLVATAAIERAASTIALQTQIPYRTLPLVHEAAGPPAG